MNERALPVSREPSAMPTVHARRWRMPGPFQIASVCLLVLAVGLIVYPLGIIIWRAFFLDNGMSAAAMMAVLASPAIRGVFVNTVVVVGVSSLLALTVGSAFAWLVERTDARTGIASEFLPLVPLLVPQVSGVIGWVILLSPDAGLLNGLIRTVLGWLHIEMISGPFNVLTPVGLVCVMTLYLVPYAYLTVSAGLQNLNPSLEEAARMCGASPWRTLRRVTIPAIWPSIVSAGIIVLVFGTSMFSVPIVIGTTAHIDLLSVRIYRLLYNYPPRTDLAVVLSIAMMVIVQGALLAQWLATKSGRHAVIGGKGVAPARVALGRWRWLARSAIALYLLATAVIPVIALAVVSLQPFWSSSFSFSVLSLANYESVLFENAVTSKALINSIGIGVVGATVGMICAAMLVLFGHGGARDGKRATQAMVDGITALPASLPHTVVAVSMVLAFTGGWLNLSGTLTIVLIANLVCVIPQAMRSARAALEQVGGELIEAAHMARAQPFTCFRRVILPLMLPGLTAGWVILFVFISGELTAAALLSGPSNPVVGMVLLDLWENGSFPQLSAIALIMTLLDAVVVLAVMRGFRRD